MFNTWIHLSKDQMLQSLIIISACIFGFQTSEVYDDKYSLSTTGSPEYVSGLEDAQKKCVNSWLLEIYDENVATLLKKLNLNIQQNGILLGMKRDSNNWRWSDGTNFRGTIDDQSTDTYVVVCTSDNNNIKYIARKLNEYADVICSKVDTEDNCSGWFHNGLCYFKIYSRYHKWFEAHNECIKNGASMATFSNSETNFNMSFIGNQKYWVSLSRGTWIWTHGGEAVTFNKWSDGQPVFNGYICATTNSDGKDWKPVDCSGNYHIVCMREINQKNPGRTQQATNSTTAFVAPNIYHEPSTQSFLPKPGGSTNFPEPTDAQPLSIGAKVGIGVGVSMLLIIIIIISGVLVFKYFHLCKRNVGQNNSRKPLEHENHYAEIVPGNNYTASTDNNPKPINYADLDLQSRGTLANDN